MNSNKQNCKTETKSTTTFVGCFYITERKSELKQPFVKSKSDTTFILLMMNLEN